MLTQLQTALDGATTSLVCNYHPNADNTVCAVYSAVQWIESNPALVNGIAIAVLIPITIGLTVEVYKLITA